MTDPDHDPSISRQAKAPGISRGSVHDLSCPANDADLTLMRRIEPYQS